MSGSIFDNEEEKITFIFYYIYIYIYIYIYMCVCVCAYTQTVYAHVNRELYICFYMFLPNPSAIGRMWHKVNF